MPSAQLCARVCARVLCCWWRACASDGADFSTLQYSPIPAAVAFAISPPPPPPPPAQPPAPSMTSAHASVSADARTHAIIHVARDSPVAGGCREADGHAATDRGVRHPEDLVQGRARRLHDRAASENTEHPGRRRHRYRRGHRCGGDGGRDWGGGGGGGGGTGLDSGRHLAGSLWGASPFGTCGGAPRGGRGVGRED
eukprot:4656983-Pleurochrysis_carterae.AAC.1